MAEELEYSESDSELYKKALIVVADVAATFGLQGREAELRELEITLAVIVARARHLLRVPIDPTVN